VVAPGSGRLTEGSGDAVCDGDADDAPGDDDDDPPGDGEISDAASRGRPAAGDAVAAASTATVEISTCLLIPGTLSPHPE
jgi:hypothetical protein